MLDSLSLDERLFWLIPLAFYVFDNAKTVAEDEMILVEDWALRWSFRLDKTPFLIRARHLYVLPLLLPHLVAVKLPWFRKGMPAQQGVPAYRRRLDRWRRHASGLRVVAICSFVLLFVAAPLLTLYLGLVNTLLLVLPMHLLLVAVASLWLCARRRALRLRRWQTAGAIAEIVLVPGYLPNICRRTAWAVLGAEVDGIGFVKRCAPPESAAALMDVVSFRLSEEWLGADEVATSGATIRAYRRELGI